VALKLLLFLNNIDRKEGLRENRKRVMVISVMDKLNQKEGRK
jgi:hypothetical protein